MANAGNLVGEVSTNWDLDFSKHTTTTNVRNNALTLDFSGSQLSGSTDTEQTPLKTIGLVIGGALLLGGIIYLIT